MTDTTKIVEALRRLDPKNNEHWTAQGLPNLEVVNAFMLEDDPLHERVMRKDVEFVSLEFNRHTAVAVEQPDNAEDDAAADETELPEVDEDAPEADATDDAEREAAGDETPPSNETPEVNEETPPSDETPEVDEETPPSDETPEVDEETPPSDETPEVNEETPAETVETVVALDDAEKEVLREELTDELSGLETQRSRVVSAKGEAIKAIDVLDEKIAKVQKRFDGEVGPIPLATALRNFIDSSHRERLRRAGRIAKIDELAGVTTNLSAKAPIDQAMARNRRRGTKRPPIRPLLPRR